MICSIEWVATNSTHCEPFHALKSYTSVHAQTQGNIYVLRPQQACMDREPRSGAASYMLSKMCGKCTPIYLADPEVVWFPNKTNPIGALEHNMHHGCVTAAQIHHFLSNMGM